MTDCTAVTLLTLAALVVAAAAPTATLAIPAFSGTRADVGSFCAERLADDLSHAGFKVVSEKQMAALIGLERQRALMGCTDGSTECIAELTNALGADALVAGSVAQLGTKLLIDVRLFSARTGERLGAVHGEAAGEEQIPEVLSKLAREVTPMVDARFGARKGTSLRPGPLVTLGFGAVSGLVGAALLVIGAENHDVLVGTRMLTAPLSYAEGQRIASQEGLFQTLGFSFIGLAVAAVVAGIVWWVVGS